MSARPSRARRLAAMACVMAAMACARGQDPPAGAPTPDGWHEFAGSWSAAGSRRILPLGDSRRATLLDIRGSLSLSGPSRPAVGFRADAILLTDSETGTVGRAAWTDEKGDQVFSELSTRAPGSLEVVGTIVGGTGRYEAATGEYSFTFGDVIAAEDGTVQGNAKDLKGRIRASGAATRP